MLRKRAGDVSTSEEETKAILKDANDRVNDPEAQTATASAAKAEEPSTVRLLCEGFLVATVVFFLATVSHELIQIYYPSLLGNSTQAAIVPTATSSSSASSAPSSFVTAPKCTTEQMAAIRKQINPASIDCTESVYQQNCPVTIATKYFNPTWLTTYYAKSDIPVNSFLAVTVGCNDGVEAVNTLRMGTMDPTVDVTAWKTAVGNKGGGTDQVAIPQGSAPRRNGKVYCVEEKPEKVDAITKAIGSTSYASKGMNVLNYEFTATNTLDSFVEKNLASDGNLNYLQLETDKVFDIISGGKKALNRTEYVIYVMDWKGSWSSYGRNTKVVTTLLDKLGFTCYWAGVGKLWRITSCMFREYGEAYKYWSHVACANRDIAPLLVAEMENVFDSTISSPS